MVDYYWLKSFTEILQLFIAVLFMIYIRVKYTRSTPLIQWLTVFLIFKSLGDLYGVINYTAWIESLLTRKILDVYRLFMATLELGMLAAYVLFSLQLKKPERKRRWNDLLIFLPALLIAPLNLVLVFSYASSLLYMFVLVRLFFISTLMYLLLEVQKSLSIRPLTISMIIWNILWLAEVVLHEQFGIISEASSWIVFILSELSFTFGITYFLTQVIAKPSILRTKPLTDILPVSLIQTIEEKLYQVMEEKKLYRHSNLTLTKLAEAIDIQSIDLTQYVNRVKDKNFNQYLTALRINESIRLLKASDELKSIEQIMHKVGFNSKSVFNTAFKKATGMTPSAFRKMNQ